MQLDSWLRSWRCSHRKRESTQDLAPVLHREGDAPHQLLGRREAVPVGGVVGVQARPPQRFLRVFRGRATENEFCVSTAGQPTACCRAPARMLLPIMRRARGQCAKSLDLQGHSLRTRTARRPVSTRWRAGAGTRAQQPALHHCLPTLWASVCCEVMPRTARGVLYRMHPSDHLGAHQRHHKHD